MSTEHAADTMAEEVGPAPGASPVYAPGTQVDRYVILEALGRGAMGAVYAAYDSVLDRRVALKFLLPRETEGLDSSESQSRLLLEARAMARVSHPNVVTLYQVGPAPDGGIFLAMELVEGGTLTAWLAERTRTWREKLALLCEAGEGLRAAHEAGLIHRDFKLDNVLVGKSGRPQVSDFGVVRAAGDRAVEETRDNLLRSFRPAKIAPPDAVAANVSSLSVSNLTLTGSMLGTPGYMAPEQYAAEEEIDVRADIFAFSVTLYRALYGTRPFEGSDLMELAEATLLGKVREPPAGSDVPAWVHKAILWGLKSERQERPASMDVLLRALRADPARARRRWLLGGLSAVAVALSAFGAHAAGERHVRECRAMGGKLDGVWDAGRKGAIKAAFRATGRGYAEDTWTRVERRLDAYAAAFTGATYEACAATRVRGEQSEAMMRLRSECLDERLDELRAVTTVYAAADVKTVENAVKVASSLMPVNACSNLDRLNARVRLPEDPSARAKIRELQGMVAEAASLRSAGKEAPSREELDQLQRRVAEAGYGPLEIAWTMASARVNQHRDIKRSEEELKAALVLAERFHEDRDKADAEVELGRVNDDMGRHRDGHFWLAMARGTLDRIGNNASIALRRDVVEGVAYFREAKYADAVPLLERAIIEAGADGVDDARSLATAHSFLGYVFSKDETRLDDAVAHARAAVSINEGALGPEHPSVATQQSNLAEIEMTAGLYDDAYRSVMKAKESFERAISHGELPENYAGLSSTLAILGTLEGRLGRLSNAAATLSRARDTERANGRTDVLLPTLGALCEMLRRSARLAEATLACVDAQKMADAEKETEPEVLVALYSFEASLALDKGDGASGLAKATAAVTLAEKGVADTYYLANARCVLARALILTKGDITQAKALAQKAGEGFRKVHDERRSDEAASLLAPAPPRPQ